MQIASLGTVNTMCIGQGRKQITQPGGFANLLSGQISRNESSGQNQTIKEDENLSNEEMMELLQLLQIEDISDLENGSEIFLQILSNPEMDKTSFIKTHLQLSDPELLSSLAALMAGINLKQSEGEGLRDGLYPFSQQTLSNLKWDNQMPQSDLLSSLSALMAGINLDQTEEEGLQKNLAGLRVAPFLSNQQTLSGTEIEKNSFIQPFMQQTNQDLLNSLSSFFASINTEHIEEENIKKVLVDLNNAFSQGNIQAAFTALTQLMQKLNMDGVTFSLNKNAAAAISSLKLLQLLSKYESSESEQKDLNAFLEKVESSLNGMVKDDKASNRREFLNQIFTPMLKEAKQVPLITRQTYSAVPILQTIVNDEQMDENRTAVPILQTTMTEEQMNEHHNVKPSTSFDTGSGFFQVQQMAKNEQLVWMMEKSGQPVSSEQLISQIEKILANSQMMKTGNGQRLFIKLNPEHLGMLKIELMQKDTVIAAKITAATNAAKELLESQLQNLKNAFGTQNIQLDKIEIMMDSNQQERFLHKDSQQGNKEQQENKKQKEQQSEEFSLSFAEALISTEA